MDLEIGVVGVGFAGEQRLHLRFAGLGQQHAKRRLCLLDDLGVALGLAEFYQFNIVADARFEVADGRDLRVQLVSLPHDVAGAVGIAPEFGRLGAGVQVVEAGFGCIPVKDASSAGSAPARFRPRSFRFPHASATSFTSGFM